MRLREAAGANPRTDARAGGAGDAGAGGGGDEGRRVAGSGGGGLSGGLGRGAADSERYAHGCRRVGAAAAFGSGAYSVAGVSPDARGLRAGDRPPGGYVPVAGIWALSKWDTAGAGYGEAGGGGGGDPGGPVWRP